jgi:hypothetical protein
MAFEDALQRLNTAVGTHLSNVDAQLDGQNVRIVFDDGYDAFAGVATSEPTAGLAASAAPNVEEGSTLVIGTDVYTVRTPQPDGLGWLVLPLQKEA